MDYTPGPFLQTDGHVGWSDLMRQGYIDVTEPQQTEDDTLQTDYEEQT